MEIAKMHSPLTALVVQTPCAPVPNTEMWVRTPMPLKETVHAQAARRIATEFALTANTEIVARALVVLKEMVRALMAKRIATEIVPMANTEIAAHVLVVLREVAPVPMVRARTLQAPMRLPRRREPRFSRKESSSPLSKPLTADFKLS